MVSADLIKQLREMTQVGFLDCKKALEQNDCDLEKAAKYLREKGIAKASKKAGAIATEGMTLVNVCGNNGVICEINCQTDFSANNQLFLTLGEEVKKVLVEKNVKTIDEANAVVLSSGQSINEACQELTAKIGEKISLRRFVKIIKQDEQDFGFYQHANKKYSALVLFSGKISPLLAKNIAMHIVAHNPKFISKADIDQTWLVNETNIVKQQVLASGKPKEFADKIVQGKINKSLGEICLYEQNFDFAEDKKISTILKENNVEILKFVRYELGEGIAKNNADFATEVAQQMNSNHE